MTRIPRHPRRSVPALATPLLLAAAAVAAPAASAQTTVFRCRSEQGTPTYSDQPCEAMGATQVRPPLEAGPAGRLRDAEHIPQAYADTRTLDAMCPARSVAELPTAVGRAFALEDVNALASLYHWPGLTQGDAGRMFGRFRTLLSQPLQNVGMGAQGGLLQVSHGAPALSDPAPATGAQLWLSVGPEHAPQVVRFDVVQNAGCVWLRFG